MISYLKMAWIVILILGGSSSLCKRLPEASTPLNRIQPYSTTIFELNLVNQSWILMFLRVKPWFTHGLWPRQSSWGWLDQSFHTVSVSKLQQSASSTRQSASVARRHIGGWGEDGDLGYIYIDTRCLGRWVAELLDAELILMCFWDLVEVEVSEMEVSESWRSDVCEDEIQCVFSFLRFC